MIKIVREYEDCIEEFKIESSKNDIPYHKIEVIYDLYTDTLNIIKTINYLCGHGREEIDEIYSIYSYYVIFKTHDINKLTDEIEKECIKKIKDNYKKLIDNKNIEISKLYNDIDNHKNGIKNLNKYFRKDKINKITQYE